MAQGIAVKSFALAVDSALLVALLGVVGWAAGSVASQTTAPQTNGRGAIGVFCKMQPNGECLIKRVAKPGPADRAGLRPNDLILRLDSADPANVVEQITKRPAGTQVTIPFQRGSEHMQAAVTVEDQLASAIRAATLGDATAQNTLGGIYEAGVGVPKNFAEALKWFRKAADQGLDDAELGLGWMYSKGEGVPKDDRAAVEWFRKAAEQGNGEAERNLGAIYLNGLGVTKDEKTAAEWYRKAAEHGELDAQVAIGSMYADGRGVAQDYAAARDWFRKAAAKGYGRAEYNLGVMYEYGDGVPKDLATAGAWYRKAAEHGNERAKQKLAELHQ